LPQGRSYYQKTKTVISNVFTLADNVKIQFPFEGTERALTGAANADTSPRAIPKRRISSSIFILIESFLIDETYKKLTA
jgi:hypothetical protein